MITISIDPIIFQIGHFALRRYGLIVLAAIQVGIWLTAREVDARNSERRFLWCSFLDHHCWFAWGRPFHVLDHWHEYP
jgi:prolipoprotein diacylglyceryltransferase